MFLLLNLRCQSMKREIIRSDFTNCWNFLSCRNVKQIDLQILRIRVKNTAYEMCTHKNITCVSCFIIKYWRSIISANIISLSAFVVLLIIDHCFCNRSFASCSFSVRLHSGYSSLNNNSKRHRLSATVSTN